MTRRERNAYVAAFAAIYAAAWLILADAVGLIDLSVWAFACEAF